MSRPVVERVERVDEAKARQRRGAAVQKVT
jgi:hypothetical protein